MAVHASSVGNIAGDEVENKTIFISLLTNQNSENFNKEK